MESEYVFTYRHNEDKIIDINHPVRKGRPAPLKRLYNLHSFLTAVRRAGIKDFQFRDLRHTCASHMVMREVEKFKRGPGAIRPHRHENDIEVFAFEQRAHEGKRKYFVRIDRLCQK